MLAYDWVRIVPHTHTYARNLQWLLWTSAGKFWLTEKVTLCCQAMRVSRMSYLEILCNNAELALVCPLHGPCHPHNVSDVQQSLQVSANTTDWLLIVCAGPAEHLQVIDI